jgi:hypothetical protein
MKCNRLSVIGLFSAASLLVGCIADDTPLQEAESPAIALNRIALNGIVANKVVATAMAESPLTIGRAGAQLVANPVSGPLLATAEGRDYFTYIVSCAMPAGQVVVATSGGVSYNFPGGLGLTPDWQSRALTGSEKRWVSACLLARVNAYGIEVAVSLRAEHPALAVGADEAATYGQAEGAFYGDVFATTDQKMEMVACRGVAQAAGEGGGLLYRDCAEPAGNGLTACGFRYAGDCQDYTPQTPSAYACSFMQNGLYQDCHITPSPAIWSPGTARHEVITVYVANP